MQPQLKVLHLCNSKLTILFAILSPSELINALLLLPLLQIIFYYHSIQNNCLICKVGVFLVWLFLKIVYSLQDFTWAAWLTFKCLHRTYFLHYFNAFHWCFYVIQITNNRCNNLLVSSFPLLTIRPNHS